MATIKILGREILGVNSEDNPFTLVNRYVSYAYNLQVDRGVLKTRPGFQHTALGVQGPFQGATIYTPGRGVSAKEESDDSVFLAFAAAGETYITPFQKCQVGVTQKIPCSNVGLGQVHLLSAENWLVTTSPNSNTQWWTPGDECATTSPGVLSCEEEKPEDGFCPENWVDWLINASGVTAYVHGRIHQTVGRIVYVGDMLYKRGVGTSKDILRMWEQMQSAYGDPQCLSTRLGDIVAAEILPATNTANGEGDLILYAERGVVSLNTFESPRRSEIDGAGAVIKQGWSYKRLKDQRFMLVTAVGRYAVAVSPRDHFFRSDYGLHSLRMSLESGTLKDEPLDNLSWQVDKILNSEEPQLRKGISTGYWLAGQRVVTSTGMSYEPDVSVDPFANKFAVFNKATMRTIDGSAIQGWEGEWGSNVKIHRFLPNEGQDFGFVATGDSGLEFIGLDKGLIYDQLADGTTKEIQWIVETGKYNFGNVANASTVVEGYFEAELHSKNYELKISIKTDRTLCWSEWKCIKGPCKKEGKCFFIGEPLGKPKEDVREASWFQFKIEGIGNLSIQAFNVDVTVGDLKTNRAVCIPLS